MSAETGGAETGAAAQGKVAGGFWPLPPSLQIARNQAIEVTEAIIFQDREDSPHSLALTIVDSLIARWLIRG